MKVMIHGFYGAGNAGDDAILHAMIDTIKQINRKAEIVVLVRSQKIPAYFGRYRIRTVPGFDYESIYDEIKTSHLLLVGGGGLFQDYNRFKPYEIFKNQNGAINYYLAPILLAKMLQVKTMLYAVGIGPLEKEDSRKTMKWIAELVDVVTVRDQHSWMLLRNLGINHVQLTADPAIALAMEKVSVQDVSNGVLQRKIGLNIRTWSYNEKKSQQAIDNIIQSLLSMQSKASVTPYVFPFNSLPSEEKLAVSLSAKLHGKPKVIPYNLSPVKYKFWVQQMDLMIGMRLHANIFAIGAGVPSIGISYDPKVKNFFRECNLPELCLDLEDVNAAKLQIIIQNIMNNHAYWKSRVQIARNRLIQRENGNRKILERLLTGR